MPPKKISFQVTFTLKHGRKEMNDKQPLEENYNLIKNLSCFKLQNYHVIGNIPGLENWHTEKSLKSIRFIKAAAFITWSSVALGVAPFEYE